MRLLRLRVDQFRGIQRAEVWLNTHSVLLGPNGVGKSSLVDAASLLLGRDRLAGPLSDFDFHGAYPNATSRIWIRGLFGAFEDNSVSANPLWFGSRGGVPQWLDCGARDVAPERDAVHDHLCVELGFCARFDSDSLEYPSMRYFVDDEVDPFVDDEVCRLTSSHLREIGLFLLPSSRTWDRTLSFASELFRRTLASQEGMPAHELLGLRNEVLTLPRGLESNQDFAKLMGRLRSELAGFIGAGESDLRLQLTTGDIRAVLDAMAMSISVEGDFRIPIGRAGSGIRAFQTLLLLLELGRARMASGKNFLLVAEEPELHLNPGLHRRLVGRIRACSSQSLATTHSPEVASYYRPEEILFLRNDKGELSATPLLPQSASFPPDNSLMRLLTVHRTPTCAALMNPWVLIPEGESEHRWLHALLTALTTAEATGLSCDLNGIGVVPTQSAAVVRSYEQLSTANPHCLPVVDGDSAGDRYVADLLKLARPPRAIVQLGDDQELEHLVAWILLGDNTCDLRSLEITAESDWPRLGVDGLATVLGSDDFKTRWDIHEEIAWDIASKPGARTRAAGFLANMATVCAGRDPNPPIWSKDEKKSSADTAVWRARFA